MGFIAYRRRKKSARRRIFSLDGGEGGIRTLDTLLTYTPLAGERLQPLGHLSLKGNYQTLMLSCVFDFFSCLVLLLILS